MLLIKEDKGQQIIALSGFGTYDMQNLKNSNENGTNDRINDIYHI